MNNTPAPTPSDSPVQSLQVTRIDSVDLSNPTDRSDSLTVAGTEQVTLPTGSPDKSYEIASVAPVSAAEALAMSLTPEQREAIQLLTSGHTLAASATAAGVNRTTLYRWLKGDAAFVAVYNAWQKDIVDTARGRILALSDLAVTTLAKSMTKGDAKSALHILKAIGALDRPKVGSTDPEEVNRIQNLEKMKAKTALTQAQNRAEMDAMMPM